MKSRQITGCGRVATLASAVVVLMLTFAASSHALVMLPPNALHVRFDAIVAFETSFDPFIDVTTGDLVSSVLADGPLTLTAFGEVSTIVDANDSGNMGSISGELTFAYTGAQLTPSGPPTLLGSTATTVQYAIVSDISGGTVSFYDDPLTGGTLNLNTAASFGGPIAVPAAATDGSLYLEATSPADTTGLIIITFSRPNALANFNSYTIDLQVANGGTFPLTGGSVLGDLPGGVIGDGFLASQLGPVPAMFTTEIVEGVLRNASVNAMIEGTFEMRLLIPEPASVGLLVLGAATMLVRRRRA